MAELSKLSDEELMKIAGVTSKAAAVDMSKLSDDELMRIAGVSPKAPRDLQSDRQSVADEQPGFIGSALRKIDMYGGGASTRAAIGALQDGEGLMGAVRRAAAVYGEDPSKDSMYGKRPPTGREIAVKAGVPEVSLSDYIQRKTGLPQQIVQGALPVVGNIDAADVAGVGIEAGADPTNLVPVGAVIKGAGKGAKFLASPALEAGEKILAKAGETSIGRTAAAIGKGAKGIVESHIKPERAPDWSEMEAIAVKHGVDPAKLPESVEFGQGSYIDILSRKVREGTLGKGSQKDFKESAKQVQDAANNFAKNVGGTDVVLDASEAGAKIRSSFDEAYKEFFEGIKSTYDRVAQANPGLTLSPRAADKLEKRLADLEKFTARPGTKTDPVLKSQAKNLKETIDVIREGKGDIQYIVSLMDDIGESVFTKRYVPSEIPPDIGRKRQLYRDLAEATYESIEDGVENGKAVADALRQDNKKMAEWFGERSMIADAVSDPKLTDDKLFDKLLGGGNATRRAEALAFILGPERMKPLKGAVLGEFMRSNQYKEKMINFNALRNDVRNNEYLFKTVLSPEEFKDFEDIIALGDRFGDPRLSTSGTGASNELGKGVVKGSVDASGNIATLEAAKARARAGASPAIENGAAEIVAPTAPEDLRSPVVRYIERATTGRSKTENILKAGQVGGAQSSSQEVEKRKERERKGK